MGIALERVETIIAVCPMPYAICLSNGFHES